MVFENFFLIKNVITQIFWGLIMNASFRSIVIFGCGNIARMVVESLAFDDGYRLLVADVDQAKLARLARRSNIQTLVIDSTDAVAIADLVRGQFAVLNTLPTAVDHPLAKTVAGTATHYLDLFQTPEQLANNKSLVRSVSAQLPQLERWLNDRNGNRRMPTPRPAGYTVFYRRCLAPFEAISGAMSAIVRMTLN